MVHRLLNQIRIEQTGSALEILQNEITLWLEKRRKKDTLQQYHTQLGVLDKVLQDALAHFRGTLNSIPATQSSGKVYADCRSCDQHLLQLRRIWSYFQSKFDQRDDPMLAPVLAAADEVVWSCYTEVFRNIALGGTHHDVGKPTTPLPYIEADYSPKAIPRDDPPGNFNTDPELRKYIPQLPIPLVSLPPLCIQEPWWLIYLGHEIGHHIQYDLVPNAALVNSFGNLLQNVVCSKFAGDHQRAVRWGRWKEEIFADLCSIYCMGPWAVRAIVELALADDKTMLSTQPRYPPAIVRLELLAHTIDVLGMDRRIALGDLGQEALMNGHFLGEKDVSLQQIADSDFPVIPPCIEFVTTTPLFESYRFRDLYNWNAANFASYGSVDNWRQDLLESRTLYPERTLQAPRMIISGAVAAWTSICTIADRVKRKESYEQLAQRLLPVLRESREEGVRGISQAAKPDVTGLGDQLAQQILHTSNDPEDP